MPVYGEKVMDYFMNPRNVGEISNADGVGTVGNPICGDMMTISIKVEDDRIADIKFKTFRSWTFSRELPETVRKSKFGI